MKSKGAAPSVFKDIELAQPVRLQLARKRAGGEGPGERAAAERLAEAVRLGFEQGRNEGRAEGLREWREEGLPQARSEADRECQLAADRAAREARAALETECERVRGIARGLQGSAQAWLAAAEDDMVALCYEALCRMLGEISVSAEVVRLHMSHLLAHAPRASNCQVHVHPQDAAVLRACGTREPPEVRWVADPEVELGGCILEREVGSLDLRLETMLAQCRQVLLDARARRAAALANTGAAE